MRGEDDITSTRGLSKKNGQGDDQQHLGFTLLEVVLVQRGLAITASVVSSHMAGWP